MTPECPPTLTHLANTTKTSLMLYSSQWTEETAVVTTTPNSRNALLCNTKPKASSNGKKQVVTIAATTLTTGTIAERNVQLTWVSAAV